MSLDLVQKYAPKVDEIFKQESVLSLVSNQDYDFTGAKTCKIYKIGVGQLNDYDASGAGTTQTRYGNLEDLAATVENVVLRNDKGFIINVDKLTEMDTDEALETESALARQIREVVVPTVDTYAYGQMVANGGTKKTETLSKSNVYESILKASEVLDENEVPEDGRCLLVSPTIYGLIKQATQFDNVALSEDMRALGVVGMLDGCIVKRVPSAKLGANTNFIMCHSSATVVPYALTDYNIHQDSVLSSGTVITGRIVYDAYVLDNKDKGVYVSSKA